jgi:hypothetical protein
LKFTPFGGKSNTSRSTGMPAESEQSKTLPFGLSSEAGVQFPACDHDAFVSEKFDM